MKKSDGTEDNVTYHYQEARRFPGEYVVFRGRELIVHSFDEETAKRAYYAASAIGDSSFIPPYDEPPTSEPIFRGRSMVGDRPLLRDIGVGEELIDELKTRDANRTDESVCRSDELVRAAIRRNLDEMRPDPNIDLPALTRQATEDFFRKQDAQADQGGVRAFVISSSILLGFIGLLALLYHFLLR